MADRGTGNADMTIKIILKNTTSTPYFKKNDLSILAKLKKKEKQN